MRKFRWNEKAPGFWNYLDLGMSDKEFLNSNLRMGSLQATVESLSRVVKELVEIEEERASRDGHGTLNAIRKQVVILSKVLSRKNNG
jgi:hypothetical protein